MSNGDPTPSPQPHEPIPDYITVHGHSNLFYFWPVWLTGFVAAALTYADPSHLVVVPPGTVAERGKVIEGHPEPRDVIVLPANGRLPSDDAGAPVQPATSISRSDNLGAVFVAVFLVTALVSTVTFRGLISLIVIITLIAAVVILALLGLWDPILRFLGGLNIRISAVGYLAISVPLFAAWALVTYVYDHSRYIIFDQGQIRLRLDVGDSETVMDANGVVVEKLRDDVFRHWMIGLGSGDLLVKVGGNNGQRVELDNVLFIGRKMGLIQRMLQERQVSAAVASPTVGAAS